MSVQYSNLTSMKRTLKALILVFIISSTTYGQHEVITDNWQTVSLKNDGLGEVNYHIFKNKIGVKKPLIIYLQFEKIYNDPKSTEKEWFGESYYKWSSFTLKSSIENMLELDIPILYVAGGNDHHSILNMDYAKLEFMRKGKSNLTYKVFPNCDHIFMETKADETGKKEWIDHLDEVNDFALEWVLKNKVKSK